MKIKNTDIVHIFTANSGTYHLAESLKLSNTLYIVNPIFFSKHSYIKIKYYLLAQKIINFFLNGNISEISMAKSICDNASLVLPNTLEEQNIIEKGFGISNKKLFTIYNGVEKRFSKASPDLFIKKYNIKDFILHVGHFGAERKNTIKLLKALQAIDYPAVFIGNVLNNNEGRHCLNLIKKNKNFLFLNWIKHSDPILESAYAAAKVFVLPSLYETPGRAALEAGLAGSNVVITPYGGTKEYFSDLVYYMNPFSVKSIHKSIIKSINTPKSSFLRNHILKNFIWEKIAEQTKNEYIKILKNHSLS